MQTSEYYEAKQRLLDLEKSLETEDSLCTKLEIMHLRRLIPRLWINDTGSDFPCGEVYLSEPKKCELGEAVPKEWFSTKEAKERMEKIDKSGAVLSASFKASLNVSPSLLKSVINV